MYSGCDMYSGHSFTISNTTATKQYSVDYCVDVTSLYMSKPSHIHTYALIQCVDNVHYVYVVNTLSVLSVLTMSTYIHCQHTQHTAYIYSGHCQRTEHTASVCE